MTLEDLHRQPELFLLRVRSGSHAYGLATPGSDLDERGVFLAPRDRFLAGDAPAQLSDPTNDVVYYELGRFLELLGKANPTALEMLATRGADRLYVDPVLDDLPLEPFLTKACARTFTGYAESQLRKARGLNKKVHQPVDRRLKTVDEFCRVLHDGGTVPLAEWLARDGWLPARIGLAAVDRTRGVYAVYYDPEGNWARGISGGDRANQPRLSEIPKGVLPVAYLTFNADAYSVYRRQYRQYWEWVAERNDERYESTLAHGRGYDAKNMMHTLRLLDMATGIFDGGSLSVRTEERPFLLSVRAGNYSLEEILELVETRMARLTELAEASALPEKVDAGWVRGWLVAARSRLYGL